MHKNKYGMKTMSCKKLIIFFVTGVFAFVFVLYLAILAAFPINFNGGKFKAEFENEFQKSTGLTLDIENVSLKPSFSPTLNIDAHHVLVLYPEGKELLKIRDMSMKIAVLPLLAKKIKIYAITAKRPILSTEIDSNGKTTLDKFLKVKSAKEENKGGFEFSNSMPEVVFNDYKIKIYDKAYSEPFLLNGKKLKLSQKIGGDGIKLATKTVLSQNGINYINFDTELELPSEAGEVRLFQTNPFRYIKKFSIKSDVKTKLKITKKDNKPECVGDIIISALSLFVDGQKSENNFIDLKINKNKIDIKSIVKTSKTDILAVTGFYVSGKNQGINLSVKSDKINLKSFVETAKAVLNILNIKNDLDDYIISGLAKLDFNLKSDFTKMQSSGYAKIEDAAITGKKIPCKINGINAEINFDNNLIEIIKSKLFINGMPVKISGSINSQTEANVNFDAENIDIEQIMALLPSDFRNQIKAKGRISVKATAVGKLKDLSVKVAGVGKSFRARVKNDFEILMTNGNFGYSGKINAQSGQNGRLILQNAEIKELNVLNENILVSKADVILDKNTIKTDKISLILSDLPITLSGEIKDYTKVPVYDLKLDGKIKSAKIYEILQKNKDFNKFKAATKGAIESHLQISGKDKNGKIKGYFNADNENYISFLVIKELLSEKSTVNLNVDYTANDLNINELKLSKNENPSDTIIKICGKLKNFATAEKIKITIPNSLTFSDAEFKNSEITLKADITADGKLSAPELNGKLEIKTIVIPQYKMTGFNNEITLNGNDIKLYMPELKIGQSKFNVKGDLSTDFGKSVIIKDIHIKSDLIDLDELKESLSQTSTHSVYPGIELPINVKNGKAEIKTFKTGGFTAENITCDIAIENNVLKMSNIRGTAYKGTLSGKSEYNFLHTTTKSELHGTNAELNPILNVVTGKVDSTTGKINYNLKMNTIGTNQSQQQRTAKGYIDFSSNNGVMGPLCRFEHFLYAQNLISQSMLKTTIRSVRNALNPKNTGVYTNAKGLIEISNGNAYLKPVTMSGPNMSLYITGRMNIVNSYAEVKIYGRISEEIERTLGDLSKPVPETIMSESSETSLGNLFYNDYNTRVPAAILKAIPPLNPYSGLSSRPFEVVITGNPDNVKSVKSFKWITETTEAPIPNNSYVESHLNNSKTQTNPVSNSVGEKLERQDYLPKNQYVESYSNKQQETQDVRPPFQMQNRGSKSTDLPDFMDNLPDNFN